MAKTQVIRMTAPVQPQAPGIPPTPFGTGPAEARASYVVPKGTLHAVWSKDSALPAYAQGRYASCDPKITHFDFAPRYTEGAVTVEFAPRCLVDHQCYLLMAVYLEEREPAVKYAEWIPLFAWHLVIGEETLGADSAVGPMRRDDRKMPKRVYALANGEDVPSNVIFPSYRFPALTLLAGSKYVLEVDEDEGIDILY